MELSALGKIGGYDSKINAVVLEKHQDTIKWGGIEGVMSFLPGVSKIKSQMDQAGVDESIISQNEAIILSMTKK